MRILQNKLTASVSDPDFLSIPADLGSRIQQQQQKRRGKNLLQATHTYLFFQPQISQTLK